MKKIIVACGSGIATSTVALQKLKEGLEERGKLDQVSFTQCSIPELASAAEGHDVIVTTAQGGEELSIPVINGMPLITGINAEQVVDEVIEILGL
ncbi:PTS sugar transporter subunit IIB [Fervidibacillus albus]|uniref:PTS sugar transporter subunit IIB n=1 Tax=Fervidibacillus albus TaxID=2980026 RepID=A0A9E8LU18_9BACI|nr:PTS sugar transporter subunit IIB [Fervidibacillus albus]WAA09365.1 PTS sugar transporter subunit IIB [Fervidibacillus albus]